MRINAFLNKIKMKMSFKSRIFVLCVVLLLIFICFLPISLPKKIDIIYEPCNIPIDGQILYSPMYTTTTYLIDNTGTTNHTWSSSYIPGAAVWWLGNGTILRTILTGVYPGFGGAGGGVQKVDWDSNIIWDFRYDSNGVLSHHDVKTLPNGNVLLIAWETKTLAEAIEAGRDPNYVTYQGMRPDHIIEVEPTGPSSGDIVWEWHVWDHLIQDYDYTKKNYGVVANHPELIDINYGLSGTSDWLHSNSIDYNEDFDQIMISVLYFNEIWVIDHSTTTQQAAGHTGGNSGKGGDLLYRWGNPQAYDAGTSSDQKLFFQHDASWITEGYPGNGNILIFNNGNSRPDGSYSSVDEIIPPVNKYGDYDIEQGSAYGPEEPVWTYTADPPTDFYVDHISGAHRLPSGNTLITNGETGELFEVTTQGETVWQYDAGDTLFKAVYVPSEAPLPAIPDLDCYGNLEWIDVKAGVTVEGNFQVENIGEAGSLLNWSVESFPAWGDWSFNPESGVNLGPEDGQLTVQVSVVTPNEGNKIYEGHIRVENQKDSDDFELIPIYLKTSKNKKSNVQVFNLLQHHLHMFTLLQKLLLLIKYY